MRNRSTPMSIAEQEMFKCWFLRHECHGIDISGIAIDIHLLIQSIILRTILFPMDYIAFLTDLMQYIPVNQRLENFQYCVSVMARTLQDSRWTGRHGSLCAAMRFTIISTFRTSISRKRRPCSTRCGHSQQNVPTSVCSRRDWCSRQSTANIPSCLPKKPYVRVKGRPKEAAEQASASDQRHDPQKW